MQAISETFCTVKEVAAKVRLVPATIRKRVRAGTFPPPAIQGAATRWRASDVEAWMRNPAGWQQAATKPGAARTVEKISGG